MSQATISERPYVNSNLFSGHYLDERVRERDEWDCDDDAREAMDDLQTLYGLEGPLVSGYGEDALIDNWIDEVLDVLGFGTQEEVTLPDGGGFVDELLFETPTARRDAAGVYLNTEDTTDLFERGVGIVEAKQWDAAFNIQFSEQRPYRNASHQTKHYLENTPPNIQWGILTNGRKWRLYGTNDYETQTYFEVDLPELLERGDLEAFKYFYSFFRPAAFHESGGTTFHDEVWSESETASQELGESLQDNVFTALRVLGRGFVETNDNLDIDPDDDAALDELKEQSLVFLYRLMFVLYAEARGLIHPEDQRAQDDYEENFSLDALRLEIHEEIGEVDEGFDDEFSTYSTGMWSRLEDLFRLIDEGEEDLGIPPYNGGLFDHDEHDFLTEHEVSNRYLAEVIYRLSTTQNDEGRYVLADYADLDTRHLGSVYEGLLEHQFRIAPEQYAAVAEDGGQVWKPATKVSVADAVETVPEGGLYVVNDEGERKATGAYYTPDYVVTYIVEETVGPLVEEIREDLVNQGFEPGTQEYIGPFFRRITDLRILDPAMGSGHFLTKATGYLSEQVMAEVREAEEEFGVAFDEQHIRREIAKECIYGVDLNGMAVELAKLSMWLETLAADRPLAFLDHHFKQGNSLVGLDIEDIEELESDTNGDDQYSLAEFGATREGTIERLMDIYLEFIAIENEGIEDVREMKRRYAEIEQDELRTRLVAMANVHTAERFDLDVPGGAYERMAKALEDDDEWKVVAETDWFKTAQSLAEEQNFFHWKLAFPETFYQQTGVIKTNTGFDAVISNPPYGMIQNESQNSFYSRSYGTIEGRIELFKLFSEKAIELLNDAGQHSFIISNTLLTNRFSTKLRKKLLQEVALDSIVTFDFPVFDDPTVHSCIYKLTNSAPTSDHTITVVAGLAGFEELNSSRGREVSRDSYLEDEYNLINIIDSVDEAEVWDKIQRNSKRLGDNVHIRQCIKTGNNDKYLDQFDSPPGDPWKPVLTGSDIERFSLDWPNRYLKYGDWLARNWQNKEFYERKKIAIRETSDRITATIADEDHYLLSTLYSVYYKEDCSVDQPLEYLLAIINSNASQFFMYHLVFGLTEGAFTKARTNHYQRLPIPHSVDEQVADDLTNLVNEIERQKDEKRDLNLDLLDYIQPYSDGPTLTDTATYRPPKGVSDTKLTATKDDYGNLRIGTLTAEREAEDTVVIHATARYKPEDEDAYETGQWGYTETEPMPAMRLTNLSETEADLVESFVPVAVEEGGGFAGFRETATKTNSLIDRLEAITLPDPDNVADDLERYREAVKRAEELNEKIQRTDDLIDEIVYELYGLTDEEIEIVEEAVGDD